MLPSFLIPHRWLNRNYRSLNHRRSSNRRQPVSAIEVLEERIMLSTISWVNRGAPGDDSDNFAEDFGSNAALARQMVDRSINDWEQVITSFNFSDGSDTYDLNVRSADIDVVGRAGPNSFDGNDSPTSGQVRVDDDPSTHFFDTTPNDDSEFTSFQTLFAAIARGISGVDFYTTMVHEIGHALGIVTGGRAAITDFLTDTGVDDPNTTNDGNLLAFNVGGGAIEATFTAADSGHLWEGPSTSATTAAGLPSHPNDLMNPGRALPANERFLITDTDANILNQAYGFNIQLPSLIDTFYADLNSSTGVLTVRGDTGSSNDTITINAMGDKTQIGVNGTLEEFSTSAINSIVVNPGNGADQLEIVGTANADRIEFSSGASGQNEFTLNGLPITTPENLETLVRGDGDNDVFYVDFGSGNPLDRMDLVFRGEGGDDIMELGASSFGRFLADRFSTQFNGGGGADRIVAEVTGGGDLDLNDNSLQSAFDSETRVDLNGVENATLIGGDGDNFLDASAFTRGGVTLRGEAGRDTLLGGEQGDVLDGGTGFDELQGGLGNDTLIARINETDVNSAFGGEGRDTLTVMGTRDDDRSVISRATTGSRADVQVDTETDAGNSVQLAGDIEEILVEGGPDVGFGNDKVEVDFIDGNPLNDIRLEFNGGRDRDSLIFLASRFQGLHRVQARFDGGRGGSDLDLFRVFVTGGTDLTLTDSRLFTPDLPASSASNVSLAGVELPELIGGEGDNEFDASGVRNTGVLLRGGGGNDTLTGGWLDDRLEGGTDDDVLLGNFGDDTLVDGAGNDYLLGDPRSVTPDSRRVGDDTFVLTPGSFDQVESPAGCDTLDFSEAELGITLDLTLNGGEVQTVDEAGNQIALTGDFESVEGTSAGDDITLLAGSSTLGCRLGADGGGGDDRISILIRELIALEEAAAIFGGPGDDLFRVTFDPQINFPPGSDPDPVPPMIIDGGSGLRDRLEFITTDRDEIAHIEETALGVGSTAQVSLFDVATQTTSTRIDSSGLEQFDVDMQGGSDQGFLQLPSGAVFDQPNQLPLSPLNLSFDGGLGAANQFHVLGTDRGELFTLTDARSFGQDTQGPIGLFAGVQDLGTQQTTALIDLQNATTIQAEMGGGNDRGRMFLGNGFAPALQLAYGAGGGPHNQSLEIFGTTQDERFDLGLSQPTAEGPQPCLLVGAQNANGKFPKALIHAENVGDLSLDAGEGDNVINAELTDATFTTPLSLDLRTGGGSDQIDIGIGGEFAEQFSLAVHSGDGMDAVHTKLSDAQFLAPTLFDFFYTDTDDVATVIFNNVRFEAEHSATLIGSGGDDDLQLLYEDVHFGGSSAPDILVDGGPGNDIIDVSADLTDSQKLTGRIALFGSEGDDTLSLSVTGDASNLILVVDGGTGNDSGILAGSDGNDRILVLPGKVMTNGRTRSGYENIETLRINAGGGDDNVTVVAGPPRGKSNSRSGFPGHLIVDGGAGNDHLKGGRGSEILIGGKGNDNINGGPGLDFLIGGKGRDRLVGGPDGDILVGGSTVFDDNDEALLALLAEWNSDHSLAARSAHIRGDRSHPAFSDPLNDGFFLDENTIVPDGERDKLIGASGRDLFFADEEDRTIDFPERVFARGLDWLYFNPKDPTGDRTKGPAQAAGRGRRG